MPSVLLNDSDGEFEQSFYQGSSKTRTVHTDATLRLTENALDSEMHSIFDTLRIEVAEFSHLGDREAALSMEMDVADRGSRETIGTAMKAFTFLQILRTNWLTAEYAANRQLVEIVRLNRSLDGTSQVATMKKPFDLLAKGLQKKNSWEDKTPLELFCRGVRGWNGATQLSFAGCF